MDKPLLCLRDKGIFASLPPLSLHFFRKKSRSLPQRCPPHLCLLAKNTIFFACGAQKYTRVAPIGAIWCIIGKFALIFVVLKDNRQKIKTKKNFFLGLGPYLCLLIFQKKISVSSPSSCQFFENFVVNKGGTE